MNSYLWRKKSGDEWEEALPVKAEQEKIVYEIVKIRNFFTMKSEGLIQVKHSSLIHTTWDEFSAKKEQIYAFMNKLWIFYAHCKKGKRVE